MNKHRFIKYSVLTILLLAIVNSTQAQDNEEVYYRTDRNYYVIKYWSEIDNEYKKGTYYPGNQVKPQVKVNIETLNDTSFLYNYTVTNRANSIRALYEVSFILSTKIYSIGRPASSWDVSHNKSNRVSWAKVGGKFRGILPEESEKGFSFESEALPGFVEGFFSSKTMLLFPDGGPSSIIRTELDMLRDTTESKTLETVGPVALPDDTNNQSLLNSIESYLQRSCQELNWITNKGICNSLEVKLRNVTRHLENEKPKQAANVLGAFLNEVEAQKDKALSSEAYALLYFNGQYLLEKLEEDYEK